MSISFVLNGRPVALSDLKPTTTLLEWLRASGLTGTKEGCAEGDCGACTVAILDRGGLGPPAWRSVCSCILLLPQLDGVEVLTVEGLAQAGQLHPAQSAMVEALGSQCGYCTPGFVLSLFEATYRSDLTERRRLDDQICGNLCRCTGYRPIRDALDVVAGQCPKDRFAARLDAPAEPLGEVALRAGEARWHRPTDWDAATALVAEGARVVAGATDLGLHVTQRHAAWPLVVDVAALPGIRTLEDTEEGWRLGAGLRLSELESWADGALPVLARMLRYFGSRQIKNGATLGGNLCNASPIGDLAPVMLALDATAVIRGQTGTRRVPMSSFFEDYRQTALLQGELLAAVEIPRPDPDAHVAAYKVSKRRELDISGVAGAFFIQTGADDRVLTARLAYGGMAATPKRARQAEAALMGQRWSLDAVESACSALLQDFAAIDDHRASAWYRTTVAANLLRGFIEETRDASAAPLSDRPTSTVPLAATLEEGA